jgi:hypothetical protein
MLPFMEIAMVRFFQERFLSFDEIAVLRNGVPDPQEEVAGSVLAVPQG